MTEATHPAFTALPERLHDRTVTLYATYRSHNVRIRGDNVELETAPSGACPAIPLRRVRRMVFVGKPRCDGRVFYECARHGVPVDMLDVFGRPVGVATPLGSHAPTPRHGRERDAKDAFALAREIIAAKIANHWTVLRRRVPLEPACRELERRAGRAESAPELRGVEGAAARLYFGHMASLTSEFGFVRRQARPAPDPVNMMLSLGYGMLHNRLASALLSCGLDARAGFFHQGRGSHFALASDLMEDMRFVVDKMVLRLVGKKRLQPRDFKLKRGCCAFADSQRFTIYLETFETALAGCFPAPCARPGVPRGTKISLNAWLDASALAYTAWLQHGTAYEPLRAA